MGQQYCDLESEEPTAQYRLSLAFATCSCRVVEDSSSSDSSKIFMIWESSDSSIGS